MKEEWRDIEGFEGKYQVSDLGRVRSLDRIIYNKRFNKNINRKGVVIKPRVNKAGYLSVLLYRNNKSVPRYIHRLVAINFIKNPHMLPEVNHIDENKGNNHLDNLEWCTRSQNINHGSCIERISDGQKKKRVAQIHKDGTIKIWKSLTEAGSGNISKMSNISSCAKGRYKTSMKCKWVFLDDLTKDELANMIDRGE
tara:strand:- start:37 stop:624 length:588 start_codon:yes stop_codon:yes gene_type:complete